MTIDTPESARALLMQVTMIWNGSISMQGALVIFIEGDPSMGEIAAAVTSHQFISDNYHVSSADGVHTFSMVPKSTLP